ncbi:MAG: nitroreductase family deazaflavin-dependent oxidoreductase [Deltaproteobacteria bacterium]|nr:MAG: nitroreductase family deazaflavin-dependent oxidoreductase [Deltaproteobacteria bacterium]
MPGQVSKSPITQPPSVARRAPTSRLPRAPASLTHAVASLRKSGETRKFPLIYGRDGDDYVLVASKGGASDNPGWYPGIPRRA